MSKNPRALAFQWRAINTLLIEVAESLGSGRKRRSIDAVVEPDRAQVRELERRSRIAAQASRDILAQASAGV